MKGKISYSSERVYKNCHIVPWHPNLIKLTLWLIELTGKVVFTSGYRRRAIHDKDSGIHTTDPLRSVDIRHYIYEKPKPLEMRINRVWTYDPKRPNLKCAFLHDTGLGMHFHLQVHDNTIAMWEES